MLTPIPVWAQILGCKIHTLKREVADGQSTTIGNTNLMVMD